MYMCIYIYIAIRHSDRLRNAQHPASARGLLVLYYSMLCKRKTTTQKRKQKEINNKNTIYYSMLCHICVCTYIYIYIYTHTSVILDDRPIPC